MPTPGGFSETYRGYGKWARRRMLPFTLSRTEALAIFESDCAYCGSPPSNEMRRGRPSAFKYNGIDRIDNALGYVPGNVTACCRICNWAKQKMTLEEFYDWVTRVYTKLASY